MKEVHRTTNRNEAERLCIFLGQHGIEAGLEEISIIAAADGSALQGGKYRVSIHDEQEPSAVELLGLLGECRALYDDCMSEPDVEAEQATALDECRPARPKRQIPWFTIAFCIAAAAVTIGFLRDADTGSEQTARRWGWRDSLDVADGSYWALMSTKLLHESTLHLVLNLVPIAVFGLAIERRFGHLAWLALFLASSLACSSAELAVFGQLGYGASGFLFLLFSFVLVSSTSMKLLSWWLLIPLSGWLLYSALFDLAGALEHSISGRLVTRVSIYAHLAGLVMGATLAVAVVIPWRPWLTRGIAVAVLLVALVPLRGSPWLSDWLLARAYRESTRGNLAAALEWSSRAVQRSESPANALVIRGGIRLQMGLFKEAGDDFDTALLADPAVHYAHAYRAQIFLYESDLERALEEVLYEIRDVEASDFAYSTRAAVLFARSELETAARDLDKVVAHAPDRAHGYASRAALHVEQSRYAPALRDIEAALNLDPLDGYPHFLRGFYHRDIGDRALALVDLNRARELLKQQELQQPRDVALQWSLGAICETLFEIDRSPQHLVEALHHAGQAMEIAPHYWSAWALRGTLQMHRERFEEAERDLSRALGLNPRDAWACCNRGLTRHHLGRVEDALRDLDLSVKLNPRSAHYLKSRALVHRHCGDARPALEDLNRAIELNPKFAEAYALRGDARLALGDVDGWRDDTRRARQIDPEIVQSK